jgi:hypothetical protein
MPKSLDPIQYVHLYTVRDQELLFFYLKIRFALRNIRKQKNPSTCRKLVGFSHATRRMPASF